ncbi:PaaI family thioesterase [Paracoccus denitrificans]|nr:PaaI family thioesterase [Paracoccus denitrificans]
MPMTDPTSRDTLEQNWQPIARPGFNELIGPIEFRDDPDGIRFRFLAEAKHRNSRGVVHGGMLMSFADTALGTTIRKGRASRVQATVQLELHFVRPAPMDGFIEMHCRIIRETRNLAFADGDILADGEIVAMARGVWKVLVSKSD